MFEDDQSLKEQVEGFRLDLKRFYDCVDVKHNLMKSVNTFRTISLCLLH